MVKVRQDHPIAPDGSVDIATWLQRLAGIEQQNSPNLDEIKRACELCLQAETAVTHMAPHSWGEGTSCLRIGMEMAEILADLQLDQDTLIAAVLYRAVRE